MTISKGDTLPKYDLQYIENGEPSTLSTNNLSSGTFVIVGVPAAFSPPCSEQHLPSYIDQLHKFQAKGAKVIVVSKDNLFTQKAWAKSFGVADKLDQIIFASDVDLQFIKALGLSTREVPPLGEASSRFALVVKGGKVDYLGQEKTVGEVTVSSADSVLKEL